MSLTQPLRLGLSCGACQRAVLSALIPELKPKIYTLSLPTRRKNRFLQSRTASRRGFSQTSATQQAVSEGVSIPNPNVESTRDKIPEDESAGDAKPWYLQMQQEEEEQHEDPYPSASRQSIPDLPDNPPPILQELLQNLSVEAGLDYLSMFDLRGLDPPPALGANLIMVFGTARSERHLHACADRFCRWLRSEHGVRPLADGMLGKNEIKLRMKRKARRAKIMSAAGGMSRSSNDDVLQTGWVCVNVGVVPAAAEGPLLQKHVGAGFAGFGQEEQGVRIVVQMLTEEKRGDMDLESLWKDVLNRAERRKAWNMPDQDESYMSNPSMVGNSTELHNPLLSNIASRHWPMNTSHQQVRHFRTHALDRASVSAKETTNVTDVVEHISPDLQATVESNAAAASDTETQVGMPPLALESYINDQVTQTMRQEPHLQQKLSDLKQLSASEAIAALGHGAEDRDSTTYLQEFNETMSAPQSTVQYACCLELYAYALEIKHPGYGKKDLVHAFRRMAASGVAMPRGIFIRVLQGVLCTPTVSRVLSQVKQQGVSTQENAHLQTTETFHHALGLAFEVLESMEAHGYDIGGSDIFTLLHLAINTLKIQDGDLAIEPEIGQLNKLNYHLRECINAIFPQPHPDWFTTMLLETYAKQRQWQTFYRVWDNVAIAMRPRTAEMYTAMFSGTAEAANIEECRKALRRWVPEMAREQPKVPMTPTLAAAMMQCFEQAKMEDSKFF